MKPTRHKFTILKQVMEIIPSYLVSKLARKHGVDKQSRSFSPWSHVVSMVFAQLSHALSLHDICDTLRNNAGALFSVRGATPPSHNGLSHANRIRNADMAQDLFWSTLDHLKTQHPCFGKERRYSGLPRRFKRLIHLVDSTTIQLIAKSIDWAQHRRRKAASKCHMRLDAQTFLPRFALVKSANTHDSTEAFELCSGIRSGEVVVFDKAYIDFAHLHTLTTRGVFWVTPAKENMVYRIVRQRSVTNRSIYMDAEIVLKTKKSRTEYPQRLRLIVAEVEVEGVKVIKQFICNNLQWAASSISDLYKCRWGIEVFFKQLKQTLQLSDFLGYNETAVRWQIWMALLTYVILRFIAYISKWKGSFARLFTVLRGVLWSRFHMESVLKLCYGTAKRRIRMCAQPQQLYLPGFELFHVGQHME